jgi:hypothetical protein
MARGSTQATGAATAAQGISNQTADRSAGLYGTLAPQLQTEAAHPQGFAPTDLAAMNTAGQQSAGGGQASAVGAGALKAARTGNAGAADAAIGEAARTQGQTLSKAALGTQMANAELKQKQQQAGLSGLESLYGTNTGASVGALGQVAGNVNADVNAKDASWNWTKLIDPITKASQAAAQAMGG